MPYNYGAYNPYQYYQPTPTQVQQQPIQYNTPVPQYQAPQQPANTNGFVWVQGEAGAKAYPVGSGNTVLLMDSENPVLYIKSTDNSGRPLPMETYDLIKRENSPGGNFGKQSVDLSAYVKRSEVNEMLESMVQKAVDAALAK